MWVGLGPEILGWVGLGFEKVTHDQLCDRVPDVTLSTERNTIAKHCVTTDKTINNSLGG